MSPKFPIALALFLATAANSQLSISGRVNISGGLSISDLPTPVSYLIKQDFEGTGYDNSETWTENRTVVDEDYTGIVLTGSQSLRVVTTLTNDVYAASPSFASQNEAWIYFQWRPVTLDGASYIAALYGGGSERLWIRVNSDGTMRIDHGAISSNTVATVTAGTTYNVWARYKIGAGTDGVGELAFSTTTTKPTSGSGFVSLANGTETAPVTLCRLGNLSFVRTIDFIYDKVRVDDVAIGDNPQ